MQVEVNFFAVLLAGVVSMIIGFLWYSPLMFAQPWMKLMGYTPQSLKSAQKQMGALYALSFFASLVTAYVLTHVIAMSLNFFNYPRLTTGVTSAFWMWLGFIAPVQLTDFIFGSKKWLLFAINTGYQLTSLIAMGLIVSYWF